MYYWRIPLDGKLEHSDPIDPFTADVIQELCAQWKQESVAQTSYQATNIVDESIATCFLDILLKCQNVLATNNYHKPPYSEQTQDKH